MLPFIILVVAQWFIAGTSGHRKLSSIGVNVSVCPHDVHQAVVEELAAQRRAQHLPPLKTTPEMMRSAKQWANAKGAGVNYKPGYATAGEYTISVREYPHTKRTINLSKTDLFAEWRHSKLGSRPWYMGEGGKGRRYTAQEWAQTEEFGIGCGTWSNMPHQKSNIFWLTVHFRYPQKMSRVELGTNLCPPGLVQSTLSVFNERRRKLGMRPLKLSQAMTKSAREQAYRTAMTDKLFQSYPFAGQYMLKKVVRIDDDKKSHSSSSDDDKFIDLRGLNLLGGSKLNSSSGAPWFTGDDVDEGVSVQHGRFFTDDEWRRTTEMGVACRAYKEGFITNTKKKKTFLMMVHFKFPPVVIV